MALYKCISLIFLFLTMGGCGVSPQAVASADAQTDVFDAGAGDTKHDPAAIYDLVSLRDELSIDLVFGEDTIEQVEGRWVRTVEYGYLGEADFPSAGTQMAHRGRFFVEVDEEGEALSDLDSVALLLAKEQAEHGGYDVKCPLRTGVVCVLAGTVANPGSIVPAYAAEFRDEQDISDSNELLFNLLSEMRRGLDVDGTILSGDPVSRAYIVHIARAGIQAITAASKALDEKGFPANEERRYVVGGHSKWGGAAAQVAAVDDRLVGALSFGFPLDWNRFVTLANERWRGLLDVDLFSFLCQEGSIRCDWTSTSIARFFASTIAQPESCEEGDCWGSGEHWLRQLDIKTLRASGHHEGIKYALLRNGREGHPVDTEAASAGMAAFPDQFLFLSESGHTLRSETHEAYWHHWVRHCFGISETLIVEAPVLTALSSSYSLLATVRGATASIVSAAIVHRTSTVYEFGPLDGLQGHSSGGSWIRAPASIQGDALSASIPATLGSNTAYFFEVTFDDGSGEHTLVTSPVLVQ